MKYYHPLQKRKIGKWWMRWSRSISMREMLWRSVALFAAVFVVRLWCIALSHSHSLFLSLFLSFFYFLFFSFSVADTLMHIFICSTFSPHHTVLAPTIIDINIFWILLCLAFDWLAFNTIYQLLKFPRTKRSVYFCNIELCFSQVQLLY